MLAYCRDTVTRSNGFTIIRSRTRPISACLASTGGALHVYSQEQRLFTGAAAPWGETISDHARKNQSPSKNSSASFKRILNVKFVLIYILHNMFVCDPLHPIGTCRTLQRSTDSPCTLDVRVYLSDLMIIQLVLSHHISIPTITERFRKGHH